MSGVKTISALEAVGKIREFLKPQGILGQIASDFILVTEVRGSRLMAGRSRRFWLGSRC